jgi:hypothetical protein
MRDQLIFGKPTFLSLGKLNVNSSSDAEHKIACAPDDALEALMSFGVLMWRAGSTAIRTRNVWR